MRNDFLLIVREGAEFRQNFISSLTQDMQRLDKTVEAFLMHEAIQYRRQEQALQHLVCHKFIRRGGSLVNFQTNKMQQLVGRPECIKELATISKPLALVC